VVREGGVSGAPNDAPNAAGGFTSGSAVGVRPPVGDGRSGAIGGASSLRIAGECRGENGGVRWRGTDGSTGRGGTGATGDDPVPATRGGGADWARGTGGGHAVEAEDDTGVFALD
jgi:hypothetical protein